ncbi:YkgJ family cysteine cluster protein [Muribaculum sp.]|uniref:YkgJ family cysteine cluster protein n=1 Tax=Muribaculum sp. TaxID=1918611 RepID=UPI00338FF48A
MKKCRTYKCKVACCYNIALPVGLLEQFADKVVNKVIATSPMPCNPEFPTSVAVETSDRIADNKCPFLRADYKCNIYEHRPLICRKFGDCSHPMLICRYMK